MYNFVTLILTSMFCSVQCTEGLFDVCCSDCYCNWRLTLGAALTPGLLIITTNLVLYYSDIQTKISSLKDAEWSNLEPGWGHLMRGGERGVSNHRNQLNLFYYRGILHILIVGVNCPAKVKQLVNASGMVEGFFCSQNLMKNPKYLCWKCPILYLSVFI